MFFSQYKENSPFLNRVNLADRFNDITKNDEGYEFRKISYPENIKRNLKFLEEDDDINNENSNDNISYNSSEKDEEYNNKKNIFTKKEIIEEKKDWVLGSDVLIPEIMKIYQKAKKFDYNIDLINIDFKDFIHNFSFENDENKNTINIPSNTNLDNNITRQRYISETFSHSCATLNNSIENNNNNSGKYIILENGKKQINKESIKCKCKNSSCLKFYCECFSNGKLCEKCPCYNCKNKTEYEDLRQEKYKSILSRNPKAIYQINSTKKSWTCNCKFSNCQKNYCDCFQNGKTCTSKCRCDNCLNKIPNINHINRKTKKIKRIRGNKNILKNSIYLTPKKRNNRKERYGKSLNNNQSTAAFTENNNSNIVKLNVFNNITNKTKYKEISLKLNMNDV